MQNAQRTSHSTGVEIQCRLCGGSRCRVLYALANNDVIRCQECDLVFFRHIGTEEEIAKIYGEEYFFGAPSYFSVAEDSPVVRDHKRNLDRLEGIPRGSLLDVGCATGVFARLAQQRGWRVSGVELSPWASRIAREHGVDVYTGTLENAGFPDNSFSVVSAFDVIEHVRDPLALLSEIRRILAPGGTLIMNTTCYRSGLNYVAHALNAVGFGSAPLHRLFPHYHLYYFSSKSLREILSRAGFIAEDILHDEYSLDRIDNVSGPVKAVMRLIYYVQGWLGLTTVLCAVARKPEAKTP